MRWNRPKDPNAAEVTENGTGGLMRFLLLLALAAWAFRSFVVAPFNIPSGSMLPTLYVGDYLWCEMALGYSRFSFPLSFPCSGPPVPHLPQRGDVAVFRLPQRRRLRQARIACPATRLKSLTA